VTARRIRASIARRARNAALLAGAAVAFYTAAVYGVLIYFRIDPSLACLVAAIAGVGIATLAAIVVRKDEEARRQRRIVRAQRESALPVERGFALKESREERESREIQTALLPPGTPEVIGYHLEVSYQPCGTLGGDFYDFLPFKDGRVLITLGDVSGKGPSGAIVMAMVQTLFRQNAPLASGPADLLRRVNDGFAGTLGKGVFVTALAGVLDPAGHRLTLAGAGHHPVLLLNARERRSTKISARGLALGIVAGDAFTNALVETAIDLAKGDTLLLYTDGATECEESLSTEVGEGRFLAAAAASVLDGPAGSLGRLSADLWQGGGRRDDTTLLLISRTVPEHRGRPPADRSTGNLKVYED
jgi:serine phosphatase RsbU (regulator of sigma subunit)